MHSSARVPTWHFRAGISQRVAGLEPVVREALSPRLRANVEKRNARMEELGGFGDDPAVTIEKNIKTFWVAGLLPSSERALPGCNNADTAVKRGQRQAPDCERMNTAYTSTPVHLNESARRVVAPATDGGRALLDIHRHCSMVILPC